MKDLICTFSLIVISSICYGQSMEKTQTAKQITIKKDTINKKVYEQKVYTFKSDTAFINQQKKRIVKLDSILNTKRKK